MASKSDIELKDDVDNYIKSGFRNTLAENHRKLEHNIIDSKLNKDRANKKGGFLAIGEDDFVDTDFINAADEHGNPGIISSPDFIEFKGKLDKTGGDFDDKDGEVKIGTGGTHGTIIGKDAATDKLAFWEKQPINQPDTTHDSAPQTTTGAGAPILVDDAFNGYTIPQVVQVLIDLGILR